MHILIVGADGTVGAALVLGLAARGYCVTGTTRRTNVARGADKLILDLASEHLALDDLPRVDAAIICAAITKFADCRRDPDVARRVNVDAPAHIAAHLARGGARTILLSSSAVFDCCAPHMRADARKVPQSHYGRLKSEAEDRVLAVERAAVLRLTKVVTPTWHLFNDWISALARGDRVSAFDDHAFCPIELAHVLEAAVAILEKEADGIVQVSGSADVTYAEAAHHLAQRLGQRVDRVQTIYAASAGIPAEEITRFTSLDTERLTALSGFRPPEPYSVLDRVFAPVIEANSVRASI